MTPSSPAELQALIAAEFDRRKWEYSPDVGLALSAEIKRTRSVNPSALAQRLPSEFLHRNQTDRASVEAAIQGAIGGRTPSTTQGSAVLHFADNRSYAVNVGRGSNVSNLNLGDGVQINIDVSTTKEQVLSAVEAVVLAGIVGDWNLDAARELAASIEARDDVTVDDVRELTVRAAEAERPTQGRVKSLLDQVAVNAVGGALGTGLVAGFGQILPHLPT